VWKTVHTGLHKTGYKAVTDTLRNQQVTGRPSRKTEKKFCCWKKWLSNPVAGPGGTKIFCEKQPKNSDVSFWPPWKYFSYPIHNGGNFMQGKVEICGVNTAKLKTLNQVEMDMLLRRAKEGDKRAREELIEGNLRLVLSVIQRFDKRGESPDDLFQVGCIGLIKAISNFDPTKNVRFSTYGVPMIAGEVRRYLRDNSSIRVSRSIRDVAYKVLQCKEAMTADLGREPSLEEIAKALDLPQEEVSRAMDAVCAPVSLYDPVYDQGGDPLTVMDQVKDMKNTETAWMEHITLQNAFKTLSPREKQILSLRFYDGKTQMEVAGTLGISQAQVSRLEKGAIAAMRKSVSVS
jgi:RNA polymerase sporulation-specific sigma factor